LDWLDVLVSCGEGKAMLIGKDTSVR
ncbi:hypothetical protein KIPB_017216, partial [Kipferlia bialata]